MENNEILDCMSSHCPKPILDLSKKIKSMNVGQVLEVIADDPGFELDVKAWTNEMGHTLLELSKKNGIFKAIIRKNEKR